MKNGVFRIIVVLIIAVGLIILNWNVSSVGKDKQVENTSTTVENSEEIIVEMDRLNEKTAEEEVSVLDNQAVQEKEKGINSQAQEINSVIVDNKELDESEKAITTIVDDDVLIDTKGDNNESITSNSPEEDKELALSATLTDTSDINTTVSEEVKASELTEPKFLEGREVLRLLADSVVTSTQGYKEITGKELVSVFAEDVTNCFTMDTAVSYNLWSKNIQSVVYSTKKLLNCGNYLSFDMGIGTGGNGSVDVRIFTDSSEIPSQEFTLKADEPPMCVVIDISKAPTLKIVCDNRASEQNRVVAYNLVLKEE